MEEWCVYGLYFDSPELRRAVQAETGCDASQRNLDVWAAQSAELAALLPPPLPPSLRRPTPRPWEASSDGETVETPQPVQIIETAGNPSVQPTMAMTEAAWREDWERRTSNPSGHRRPPPTIGQEDYSTEDEGGTFRPRVELGFRPPIGVHNLTDPPFWCSRRVPQKRGVIIAFSPL